MAKNGKTPWRIKARYFEFCNCTPGCGCNFQGFPTSKDGSCRAVIGNDIVEGSCGDVDLAGVKAVAIVNWPKAIHDGGGKVVFVVEPATSEEQIGALAQIYTGQLGGMPWEILGTTYEVAGLAKAPITFQGGPRNGSVRIEGIGEAKGEPFKNPVTGAEQKADIVLEEGFIWKHGVCGEGTFQAEAEGVRIASERTSWVYADVDWSNQ